MFDADAYLAETREFVTKTVAPANRLAADLALDRMRYTLYAFGGMGKPHEQEIDTDTVTIRLTWRRGTRCTTIEVNDKPGFVLEWRRDETRQRLSGLFQPAPVGMAPDIVISES